MPAHIAVQTAKTFATKIAQSETAREIAKSGATAAANALSQKALQRFDEGRPAARARHVKASPDSLPPRKDTLPTSASRLLGPPELSAFALYPDKVSPKPPEIPSTKATPLHLPAIATFPETWPKQAQAPARPALAWRPSGSNIHALPDRPPQPAASFRTSFRQALRALLGGKAPALVGVPSTRPAPDRIAIVSGRYGGQSVALRLSRQDTRAFQQQHSIPDGAFDVRQYLAYAQARHDPLTPGIVKVSVDGRPRSLQSLDLRQLELNDLDSNRRVVSG